MHIHSDHISGDVHTHDHDHAHTHEHSHDGVAHTHEHVHSHSHDHSHPHDHEHLHDQAHTHEHTHDQSCGGNCGTCQGGCEHTPMEELAALMKYMVGHNASHARELAQLAEQLKKIGNTVAYEQVMAAVSDFEKGNMRLSVVLSSMDIK